MDLAQVRIELVTLNISQKGIGSLIDSFSVAMTGRFPKPSSFGKNESISVSRDEYNRKSYGGKKYVAVTGISGRATMITIRKATVEDKVFLWNLKVAAMRPYVERVYGWDDAYQYDYFEDNFHPEALDIIQNDGQDVGMYKLQKNEEGWYLAQIEITPELQNRGIGSTIIERIIDTVSVNE